MLKSLHILIPLAALILVACGKQESFTGLPTGISTPTPVPTSTSSPTPGSYQVNLTWDAPASSPDPVAGYNIYRAPQGSTAFGLVGSVLVSSTTYSDTSVALATSYCYFVESADASGNQSAPSNEACVTVPATPSKKKGGREVIYASFK